MKETVITVDSAADIPADIAEEFGIKVMPMYIVRGGKALRDGVDITARDIFDEFDKTGTLPKTSAVSPGEYLKFFGEFCKQGKAVVHLSFCSKLSSTHRNAKIASARLGDVYVLDTDNLGGGIALPALKGCKMRDSGASAEEIYTELEKLRGKHPMVQDVLDYRMLTKLKSTYADGLLKEISADGRIHTNFQMTVTATGRLSSTEPNLQNIPVRRELGAQIRNMFVASPGKVLVDADYSQIELRLLAHIANDETMIAAFRSGEDIHAVTASQVFGVPLDEVTPLQRSHAKAVNFGIVYGISAFSLAQDIGVFQSEAKAYMDSYFAKYHGVRAYMDRIVAQAKADGYVTTLFGRRRDLPELKSSNFNLRSFGERVALNMPIQGTAADIIKAAMVRVDARMRAEGLEAQLLLQVHDELIVECPAAEAETVRAILIEEMEHVVDYRVPLLVDAKIGASWAEAH